MVSGPVVSKVGLSSSLVPGGLRFVGLEKPTEPFTPCQSSSALAIPGPSRRGLSAEAVVWTAVLLKLFSSCWSEVWRSLEVEELNQKRLQRRQQLSFQGLPVPHPHHLGTTRESPPPSGIF